MKYKHILYPTDGSKEAKKALSHVKKVAETFESAVTVFCAFTLPYSLNNSFVTMPPEIYEQYKQDNQRDAKRIVDEIISELVHANIDSEPLIVEGNPKILICEYAQKLGCDLIIMGTRGHSQVNYIGSTSTYVINNVKDIAVMVVS